jgi:hypothetical protein
LLELPLDQPALIMAAEGEALEALVHHIKEVQVLLFRIQVVHRMHLEGLVFLVQIPSSTVVPVETVITVLLFSAASPGLFTKGVRELRELLLLALVNGNICSMQCWL